MSDSSDPIDRAGSPLRCGRRRLLRIFGATLLLPLSRAQAADQIGAVEEVRGEASAQTGRVQHGLQQQAAIYAGDLIATGAKSRLGIRFNGDIVLRLGERTRITVEHLMAGRGGQIVLEDGAILFDGPARLGGGVQIRSPYGTVDVRGTRFFAGRDARGFGVFVARGRVAVAAGGRSVTLRAGEGTDLRTPGARPTAPARWSRARIRAALDSVL